MSTDFQRLSSSQNLSQATTQGNLSGVIAPHGLCSIWTPNKEEIRGGATSRGSTAATATELSTSGLSDESTPGISEFSCDFCDKTFNSRETLKQHRIKEHN